MNDYLDRFEKAPLRTGFRVALIITLGVLAIGAIVSVLVWGFNVGTSDVKGRGDAIRQRNSGTNRVFAQQHFEDLKAAIDKDVANIRAAKAAAATSPTQINQTNVTGAQQVCNGDVADYNAAARKYLERDFRASDLPSSIDLAECGGE